MVGHCIVYDKKCSFLFLLSISWEVAEEVGHVFLSAKVDFRDKDLVKGSQLHWKDNLAFGESRICAGLLGLVMYFFNHQNDQNKLSWAGPSSAGAGVLSWGSSWGWKLKFVAETWSWI